MCTLPARTSILAAAQPVGGHYNKGKIWEPKGSMYVCLYYMCVCTYIDIILQCVGMYMYVIYVYNTYINYIHAHTHIL